MKKAALAVFAVCLFVGGVKGEVKTPGTYWHVGQVEFWYPLAHVDATPYWKSITTGEEMFGAQTDFFSGPRECIDIRGIAILPNIVKLSVGGITSTKANGMPYAALTIRLWNITNLSGQEISYIGWGYGHDFKENKDHLLLGASFKLW